MALVKELARWGLRQLRSCIPRIQPTNRFQAMDETIRLLRRFGYSPRVVVDGGANVGSWAQLVCSIFPTAEVHLIEPQPECHRALVQLVHRNPNLVYHPVAVTEPEIAQVRMIGGGQEGGGTGAWVARAWETLPDERVCPATTLDALLAERVTRADRAFLKLDLEGHEVTALRGAEQLLQVVEVILTELQFYEVNDNKFPVFTDVLNFLSHRGFALYDFACLSPRPRDMRLRMGDVVFVRQDSPLWTDRSWE